MYFSSFSGSCPYWAGFPSSKGSSSNFVFPFVSQIWRSWSCKRPRSATEQLINAGKIDSERYCAKQRVRVRSSCYGQSFLYLAYNTFLFSSILSPAAHLQRQPGRLSRPWSGKSWESGTHSPPKSENDSVLANFLIRSHRSSYQGMELLLYFIWCVEEMLCFSRPPCMRVGGWVWVDFQACDFCASVKCSPEQPETPRAHLTTISEEFMQPWTGQANSWTIRTHLSSGTGVVCDGIGAPFPTTLASEY